MTSPRSPRSAHGSQSPRRSHVTLENLDRHPGARPTSPRSLEVCRRCGIDPDELIARPPSAFALGAGTVRPGVSQSTLNDLIQRRFEHFEQKRLQKLRFLREERERYDPEAASAEFELQRESSQPMTPRTQSRISLAAKQLQQSNYELIQQRRKEVAAMKMDRLARAIDGAEAAKDDQLQRVSSMAGEHIKHVRVKHFAALVDDEMKHHNALAKHSDKSFRLDERGRQLSAERELQLSQERLENDRRRREAKIREQEVRDATQSKRQQHWSSVEEEIAASLARQEEVLAAERERNALHFRDVKSVHDGTRMSEELAQQYRAEKQIDKELTEEEFLRRQLQSRSMTIEHGSQARAMSREQAKSRASQHLNETVTLKSRNSFIKHSRFDDSRHRLIQDTATQAEISRETVEDHTEEVKRTRKSQDYHRQQHMEAIVRRANSIGRLNGSH